MTAVSRERKLGQLLLSTNREEVEILTLGTLRDGVFRELSREDETDGSLDFARRDGRLLVVRSKLGSLTSCLVTTTSVSSQSTSEKGKEENENEPILSKMSLTNEFKMSMALFEIPVSG